MTKYIQGILLSFIIAIACLLLAEVRLFKSIGLSAVILAIIMGMLIGNLFYPRIAKYCHTGVDFCKSRILRLAIILFGVKITFHEIALVGFSGVTIDVLMVGLTFVITLFVAIKWLKMDRESAILIGSGCSICGAAAIIATEPTIKASSEKVTIAVAVIVVFGTIAMFIYPLIFSILSSYWQITESAYGIYIGSTIHEVAQAVAAGNAVGEHAVETAVISKMIRVLLLAPFLFILSLYLARSTDKVNQKIVIPWFAVGFLAMACINSTGVLPKSLVYVIIQIDNVLLAMAMTALGLTSHYSVFKKAGVKPLLLGLLVFIWLVVGGATINFVVTHLFSI